MIRILVALFGSVMLQAAALELGEPLELKDSVAIKTLIERPDDYVGKHVQVRGKITEVCQMMGCWTMLRDEAGATMRIKVNDGEIVFPKESPGRTAVAEGELVRLELNREQAIARAKHQAEETGRPFDPSSIKGPQVIYQIQGRGAVLLD